MAEKKKKLKDVCIAPAAFKKQLSEDKLCSVYVFYGSETYMKEAALAALEKKLLPDGLEDLNRTILEGAGIRQVLDAAETMPFMADRRVVIVRDWGAFYSGKVKNEDADVKELTEWLKRAPDTCCVVFYLREEPQESKACVKAMIDASGAGQCVIVNFEPLSGSDLYKWISSYLKKRSKKIGSEAAETFSSMIGGSAELNRVIGELEKLIAYTGDEAEITKEDVEAIVAPSQDYVVYGLVDLMIRGDVTGSERMIKALLLSGSKPTELVSLIAGQLRRYLLVSEGLAKHETNPDLMKWLGFKWQFQLTQTIRTISRYKPEKLTRLYQYGVDADYSIKSGQVTDEEALHRLVIRITSDK